MQNSLAGQVPSSVVAIHEKLHVHSSTARTCSACAMSVAVVALPLWGKKERALSAVYSHIAL